MAEVPAEIPAPTVSRLPGGDVLVGMTKQNAARQFAVLIAIALSVALGVGVVMWMQTPNMRPIAASADPQQALRITQTLNEQGIPFKVHQDTGLISVPTERFHDAQMRLAITDGVDGRQLGYELLDRDQGLGISQFMEESNMRRGLEGELARSIETIRSVRSARVLLATPRTSSFLRDCRQASAAVTLVLDRGAALDSDATAGISKLVAGAVPNLSADQVTVIDQQGRLLSTTPNPEKAATQWQLEYIDHVESSYRQKIENLLLPVVGVSGFIAEVAARVDFTAIEQTEELYNSDLPALRSEQTLEEERSEVGADGGVPGALTNQPPAVGVAPEVVQTTDADGAVTSAESGRRRAEVTRNYELDRTISHTRRTIGELERLTVSVLLADRAAAPAATTEPADGEDEQTASENANWTAEELAALERAIQGAVGFDASRGDTVSVTNSAFLSVADVEEVAVPFYAQPWFASLVKQGLGGLGLIAVIFGLLRPMYRNLVDAGSPEAEAYIPVDGLPAAELPAGLPAPPGATAGSSESYMNKVDAVRGLVSEDPARVAQVVKHWVADE